MTFSITTFLAYVLGTDDLTLYIAKLFFAFVGGTLLFLINLAKRDPNTPDSPVHFSFRYMVNQNWLRFTTSSILIFIFMRFPELVNYTFTSMSWEFLYAFLVGVGCDQLGAILKKLLNKVFGSNNG